MDSMVKKKNYFLRIRSSDSFLMGNELLLGVLEDECKF